MKGLGFINKKEDKRDYIYAVSGKSYPESFEIDLKGFRVHDQGSYQNCAAHALSALIEIVTGSEAMSYPWYYGNRRYSDHKGEGTEARGLLKAAQKDGGLYYRRYPFEAEVMKVIDTFNNKYEAFKEEAQRIKIGSYRQCLTIDAVKDSVMKGMPVLVGTLIFKSFYEITKDNPVMPEPRITNGSLEEMAGGHMMLITGFNKEGFKVLNSWGDAFGDKGTFIMPYSIVYWSERNNFPIPMFEAWAIDKVITEVTMENGWYKKNGKWRYAVNGVDRKGWFMDKDKWYYFNTEGDMLTGWLIINDRWYYLSENGDAVKGFKTIKGKNYYFAEEYFGGVKECQLIMTDKNGAIYN